jgi:cytochrome P450
MRNVQTPKGAVVIPNLDSVMHDETIFPDSCKFDPTRFLDDDISSSDILLVGV